jgi:hypothetical protein
MVRGKFIVAEITQFGYNKFARRVKLSAVTNSDPTNQENVRFHQATPTGEVTMHVDNPAAAEQFEAGDEFYVDFTKVQK